VFTPNSDGSNQYFVFGNLLDFKVRKLTVYDRWGKEIYSNDNYDNMWDGGDATAGTYYWVLEYANETISKNTHGIVNIIK
jgi:gliding motility-associated-like protein